MVQGSGRGQVRFLRSNRQATSQINHMNKGLHLFTLLVTFATFILILAGALVTSNGAGLAAPDWPLSYGQFFPKMVGNLFYEHGHRLIATTVGLLVILLNIYLWRREPRRWVRRLGLLALVLVIVQGLFGGLTVKLLLPRWVSSTHACLAQLFFSLMVCLSIFTSPDWQRERAPLQTEAAAKASLPIWFAAAFVTVLVQLVLGATLRHSASWDQYLPTELVIAHLAGACLVTFVLGGALFTLLRRHRRVAYLARPAVFALALLVLQILLGVAAYVTRLYSPEDPQPLHPMVGITVAHVATGALVLITTLVLTLRSWRVLTDLRPSLARGTNLKIDELKTAS